MLFLEKRQKEYAENFAESTIEMNDFAVEFHNIPKDDYYRGNPLYFKAILWDKLEMIMQD